LNSKTLLFNLLNFIAKLTGNKNCFIFTVKNRSDMHHSNHRIGFKSKFGAIAALAGSAVGLGNIWKFPYVAGTNGGGAFLLVYIFFTIAIGLPVMLAEFSLGRRSQQNALGTFRVLAPGTKWFLFGLLSIIAAFHFMERFPAGRSNMCGCR
jgi:NSS family neurotransmitter:Na+ symporter